MKTTGRIRRWLARNWLAVVLGVAVGFWLDTRVTALSLPALHRAASDRRAEILLRSYSESLCALSLQAERFRAASFKNVRELRTASEPLIPAIDGLNKAYREVAAERLNLSVALTRAWPHTARRAALVEQLADVDAYQWVRLRPAMNSALVFILIAWRHDLDMKATKEIDGPLKAEWKGLPAIVRDKANAIAETDDSHCERSTGLLVASSQAEGSDRTRRKTP